jgi:2-polyprenyl-3-methyl-5-hydroxy-6-metoxy-1,4-benzoquinol methylase
MASIIDDRGFNQGFKLVKSTELRMRRRADWIASEMTHNTPKNVLEIGCGTGEVSYWIAEKYKHEVLGTDLCLPFIDYAKNQFKLPNLNYEVLNFSNTKEVNDRKFDYIFGNGILHHLYNSLDSALKNMHHLLNKGGKIIFMEPNIYNPYCAIIFNFARNWAKLEPDEMAFSKKFISKKLEEAGYSNIKIEFKDFLLPGVPNFLINPSIKIGNVLEKIPLIKYSSQSLFISAEKL